jgi:hypothetical protein
MKAIGLGIGLQYSRVVNGIDPSAIAFITAAGITDSTQINAINRLVKNYKGIGDLNASVDLWNLDDAIYPIVGGSATSHKFNLKNPLDTDAAYRLAFSGGWTHSSNGALPNGTNAYANTFLSPNALSQNSCSLGLYSRTNNTSVSIVDAGVLQSVDFSNIIRWDGSLGNLSRLNNGFVSAGYIPTKTSGDFFVNRTASNVTKIIEDGVVKQTKADTSTTPPSIPIFLGARNTSGAAAQFSNRAVAFATIGAGLTDAQALIRYNIIQAFQTDLGRQV